MPRDGAAALKAWAKRKRAEGNGTAVPVGPKTVAAVRAMGGGVDTRVGLMRAHGAVVQAKQKLERQKLERNRLAAGLPTLRPWSELPSVGPRRMATGTSGVSLSTPPPGARIGGKDSNSMPVDNGWPRPSSKDSKSMPVEPSVHGPKPKVGPMAGMATLQRKAIGAKAAEKRKANKAAADKLAGEEQMKKLDAMNANKKNAGAQEDLFGREVNGTADRDGSPLSRTAISDDPGMGDKFFKDFDAHVSPLRNKPVQSIDMKAKAELGGIMPKATVHFEDGTKGNFKIDIDSFFEHGRRGITNRAFPASAREEASYALDKSLGLGVVPPAVQMVRDVPSAGSGSGPHFSGGLKTGSQHEWVTGKKFGNIGMDRFGFVDYLKRNKVLSKVDERSIARMAVLDVIVGHTDRHTGNAVITPDGKVVAIDNGHVFGGRVPGRPGRARGSTAEVFDRFNPEVHQILRDAGRKADVGALKEIRPKLDSLDVDGLAKRYKMTPGEKDAIKKRVRWLKNAIDLNPGDFLNSVVARQGGW